MDVILVEVQKRLEAYENSVAQSFSEIVAADALSPEVWHQFIIVTVLSLVRRKKENFRESCCVFFIFIVGMACYF